MVESKIEALFIFEVMGKPPEHLKKSLEEYLKRLGGNKGIKIIKQEIHEPKPIEESKEEELFTTFAEVTVVVDNINLIFDITLNMLPAHAEIIKPDTVILRNFDLSEVVSSLSVKLHKYDEIAKTMILERDILIKKLQEQQQKIKDLEGGIKKPGKKNSGKKKISKKK